MYKLLHGLHYGVMAIILPHGVLFRGGAEERIPRKLLEDGHIDTVIGLPANLFYSIGSPVCVLVLKKCKKPDDAVHQRGRAFREVQAPEPADGRAHRADRRDLSRADGRRLISRRVEMKEIEGNDYNLNISRHISTPESEAEIDLAVTHARLVEIDQAIRKATATHNEFPRELGLPELP